MIRGFFRLIGLLLLAGGFIFMVYDGARWVADQNLRFTRFGAFWNDMNQASQAAFKDCVDPFRQRPPAEGALSAGPRTGRVRAWLFLGRGA